MNDRFPPDVILLAAGLGTRMSPLTNNTPKPLIKVAGERLMDRVNINCLAEDCVKFAINAHHHLDQMQTHFANLQARFPAVSFALSEEPKTLLDTGGGAKKALDLTNSDSVLIINSDTFWPTASDRPLARMHQQFSGEADVVLLCAHPARATGFRRSHDFCLAPDKKITHDRGVPVIYAGAALVSRTIFNDTQEGPFSLLDLFDKALQQKTLHGVLLDAPWLHVGDPEAIKQAEAMLA